MIIYDLNKIKNRRENIVETFILLKIVKNILQSYCNFLPFCKAFDTQPDLENKGYQVEIIDLSKI